jgi:FkbM family methyltransferase
MKIGLVLIASFSIPVYVTFIAIISRPPPAILRQINVGPCDGIKSTHPDIVVKQINSTWSLRHHSVQTNINMEPKDEVCSSLRGYDVNVSTTTRIRFKDGKTALIANSGQITGKQSDGDLHWYKTEFPGWEHTTFLIFRALIKPDTVYVGFGEWTGPTILYSAQLAKASYGFEPDMIAFRKLALNAKANQCFGDRLKVFSSCIYLHFGELFLNDEKGNSMSSIVDPSSPVVAFPHFTTTVKCITLEHALTSNSLLDQRLFFKVDTEGAEAVLIPSFLPLMRKLKHKPIWYISKHQSSKYAAPEIQQGFRDLIALYKCHRVAPAAHQTHLSKQDLLNFKVSSLPIIDDWTLSNVFSSPDLILVDTECTDVDERIREIAHFFA